MKSVKLIVCAVLVLLTTVTSVSAASTQHVVLTQLGEELSLTAKYTPAAWETPTLKAGEMLDEAGKLTLTNQTGSERQVRLDEVAFPYGNADAMTYLNHLYISLCQGETVLYSGMYSRINENGGLNLSLTLAPQETAEFDVYLRCDHTAPKKTGFETGTLIDWKFYTVVTAKAETPVSFTDPSLREALLAAAIAVALLGGVGAYEIIRRKR